MILNLTSPAPNNGSFGALHHILRNPSTVARVQGNKNDGNTTKVKASEFVKAVDNAACHKLCSFLPEKVMHNSSERCTNKNLKSFPINILKIFCHLIFLSKLWLIVRNPRSVSLLLPKRSETNTGLWQWLWVHHHQLYSSPYSASSLNFYIKFMHFSSKNKS